MDPVCVVRHKVLVEGTAEETSRKSQVKGPRVLYEDDGRLARREWLRWTLLRPAERLAGLPEKGRFHILRHTFCSRLAARNVPMLTIKELAGHASIETTMRYMHLSSAAPKGGNPGAGVWRQSGDGPREGSRSK